MSISVSKFTCLAAALSLSFSASLNAQTTATDFTVADCSGVTHNLFSKLDGGTIVVGVFVMPCVGCISPAIDVQNVTASYAATHPGRVEMMLIDDDGLTDCPTLMSWRNANGIHLMPTISNLAVVQSQYGTLGMPKIVVLGGTDHKIYGNQNDVVDIGALYSQIDAALGLTTGVVDAKERIAKLKVYPNPAEKNTTLSFHAEASSNATVRVVDLHGRSHLSRVIDAVKGENSVKLDLTGIAPGIYSVLVVCGSETGKSQIQIH